MSAPNQNLLFFGEHVLDRARLLPDESVHCICTSPPYWGLRNYGTEPQIWPPCSPRQGSSLLPCPESCPHVWGDLLPPKPGRGNKPGDYSTSSLTNPDRQDEVKRSTNSGAFCSLCGCWRGELGLEPTPELYVHHLTLIFHELRRVLRKDGTLWLNLGDSYAANRSYQVTDTKWTDVGNTHGMSVPPGLKPKDLVGIPWMVAFALRADGWYLRQEIIWHKPNPMPESVQDRCTKSHESIFLFSKSARYFFDHLAIAEPSIYADSGRESKKRGEFEGKDCPLPGREPFRAITQTRNRRSVWTIPTVPYPEAHYAVFPPELPRLCILAGTSAKGCCPHCGAPYERTIEKNDTPDESAQGSHLNAGKTADHQLSRASSSVRTVNQSVGWQPTCACAERLGLHPSSFILHPCSVLDPFAGSGTTLAVAAELGRNYIGIELDEKNRKLCEHRLARSNRTVRIDF